MLLESILKSAIAWENFIDPHYSSKSDTRLELKCMEADVTNTFRLLWSTWRIYYFNHVCKEAV